MLVKCSCAPAAPDDVPWTSVAPKLDDRFYEPDFAAIKKQAWALGKSRDLAGALAYGNDRRQNVFIRMKVSDCIQRPCRVPANDTSVSVQRGRDEMGGRASDQK